MTVTVTAINPAEPVNGGMIFFTAPDTGASATLSAASATVTNGQAGVSATAGMTAGSYTVTASPGLHLPAAGLALTNTGPAASVAVASGSGQTAVATKAFAAPLVAVVTDSLGNPVPGVTVNFAAPGSGASAALTGSPAVTGADGRATVTATANAALGSYTVTASVAGVATGAAFALTNVEAPSLVVNTVVDEVDDTDGTTSLREALAYANSRTVPSTVTFAPSVFGATPQTITLTQGQLTLNGQASITIAGSGANLLTVSGNQASQVFQVEHGVTASISALTITGAQTQKAGGGLVNYGTVTLSDCVVSGNSATAAAGLNNKGGTATLINCTVSGNTAVAEGGGLENSNGTLTLTDCTVSGNTAGTTGGGVENFNGPITLTDCTLSGNTATDGGGLTNFVGTATLVACTVSGNTATAGGGLLNKYGDTITLTSTIVAAQKGGGDIFVQSGSVTGNYNLIGDGSGISGGTGNLLGTPSQPLNPLLAPLGDYGGPTLTMALLPGSPALGKGDPAQSGSNDQRGQPRGAVVDIGAFQQNRDSTLVVGDVTDKAGTGPGRLSLRQAVNLATLLPGVDTITFDPNVFGSTPQTITLSRGQLALINRSTTIIGPGAGLLTISGGGQSRVFDIEGGSAVLSGLTISGGQADNGAGLYHNGGTLSLTGCTVSGNTAGSLGGGLGNQVGTATLTNCTVSGNTAAAGGGVGNFVGAVTLTNCTVSGNTADQGGGLYGYNLSLSDCNVSGNTATDPNRGGGGLYIKEGRAQLLGCTVSGNSSASSGGGLDSQGGTLTLTDCTLSGNTANSGGGLFNYGLYGYLSSASLTNCTVSGNFAVHGGGLWNSGDSNSTGHQATITLANTIVASQKGGGDILVQSGSVTGNYNLIGDGSGISGGAGNLLGTPSQPLDPLLAPLGDYGGPTPTMALLPGSPAIGGGTATGAPTTDQRGFGRGSTVDIGAFQHQGFTVTPVTGSTPQTTPTGTSFAVPLAVMVTANNAGQFVNPVDGGVIRFAAPPAGASAILSAATAVIAGGQVGVTATANTTFGSYTVTASMAGVTTPAGFELTNTAAPQNLVAQPVAAVAGRAFINVVVATFTDSDPEASPSGFVAAIAWGDGITTSSTTVIADGQGHFDVLGTHTYVDAGTYTFHVQVTDSNGDIGRPPAPPPSVRRKTPRQRAWC